ncbi:MAG: hypothetical protein RLP44_17095 [Aggregatilineales bacterium]
MRRFLILIMLIFFPISLSLNAQTETSIIEVARIGLPTITDWSPTGQYGTVLSSTALIVYNETYTRIATLDLQQLLPTNDARISVLKWHSDERFLAVEFYLGQTSKVIVWDTRTWSDIFQLDINRYLQMNWHPTLSHLAIGGQVYDVQTGNMQFEHLARLAQYDLRTREVLVTDETFASQSALFWNADGSRYVAMSYIIDQSSSAVFGIFDSSTNEQQIQLQTEHVERRPVFFWNADGTILTDGVISWDTATGARLAMLDHPGYGSIRTNYSAILWHPDNEHIVTQVLDWTSDFASTIYLWDARTGDILAENNLYHPLSSLYDYANHLTGYTRDGYRIMLDSNDLSVVQAERVSPIIMAHTLAWSPDSTRLLTAGIGPAMYPMQLWSRDGLLTNPAPAPLWTVHDRWADYELRAQQHYITGVQLSWLADSTGFITSSTYFTVLTNTMRIDHYDATNGTLIEPLFYTTTPLYESSLNVAEVSADLSRIARFSHTFGNSAIEFADFTTGQTIARMNTEETILIGRWNPQGTLFAGGEVMQIWRVGDDSAQLLHRLWVGTFDIAWSPDGMKLALVRSGQIAVFDALSGETLINWDIDASYKNIAWHSNEMLAMTYDDMLELWNISDNSRIATVNLESPVNDLAWSPDGNTLALAMRDGTLRIYTFHVAD